MPSPRVDLILDGKIQMLLDLNYTYDKIITVIKDKTGQEISRRKIQKVKERRQQGKDNATPEKRGPAKMNGKRIQQLKTMAMKPNPLTQRQMAVNCGTTQSNINYHLHTTLGLKTRKKTKTFRLSPANIQMRKERTPGFKRIVEENKEKIVTTDESMFSMQLAGGNRTIFYECEEEEKEEEHFIEQEERFAARVMVWGGISYNHKTDLYFIEPGVKVNSQYYQEQVLDLFKKKDQKRMFPDGDFLFHQDSAPSHVSGTTLSHFQKIGIPLITKDKWPSKSPDLAPMDFFVWGWMKGKLRKKRFRTKDGMRRAIKAVWNELPQEYIQNAFDSWAERCQKVIDANGGHIK